MNLGKPVTPGQKLSVPADLMNVLRRMAQDYLAGDATGAGGGVAGGHPEQALIRNDSGATVTRFGILGIDDVLFTPDDHLGKFQSGYAFKGVTPAVPDHVGKFAVMLEAVPAGLIGRGLLVGNVAVQVNVNHEEDGLADVLDGDATQLDSGPTGAAQILWKPSGTGTKWAVVRVGSPGPFELIRFSGICMIDSLNPTAKSPGVNSAYSKGSTTDGHPTDQQWLLMKFAGAPIKAPWQAWNWHIPMIVSATGGTSGWFVYWAQLILNDFYVADDPEADPPQECATWATSPLDTTWGLGGNGVSAKIPTSSWIFPDGQSLNIDWVNSAVDGQLAYGIALKPEMWWNWGNVNSLNATIQADHTKCRITA